MKSAAYASFVAAGAIPQEQDDDCRCSSSDSRKCLEEAVARSAAEDVFLQPEDKCTCECHSPFEKAVKLYGERATAHVRKMMEDGVGDETLLEVVRQAVESAVRLAANDRFMQ